MKIGIISDTHGLLRQEVLAALEGSCIILHGGDINRQEILNRLEEIAPVYVVRGNNDKEWAEHIPYVLDFEYEGLRICMSHKKKDLPGDLAPFDLVIVGHTHKYEHIVQGKTTILNPGSCGPRRFHQAITMATAEVEDGRLEVTRIDIPHEAQADQTGIKRINIPRETRAGLSAAEPESADLKSTIEMVVRETQKNRSPGEIASRHGLDADLVEQIARLYLTHPGVTADGILTKMGY